MNNSSTRRPQNTSFQTKFRNTAFSFTKLVIRLWNSDWTWQQHKNRIKDTQSAEVQLWSRFCLERQLDFFSCTINGSNQIYHYPCRKKVALNSLYKASGDSDAMIRLHTELLPKAEVNSENSAPFFQCSSFSVWKCPRVETGGALQCLC